MNIVCEGAYTMINKNWSLLPEMLVLERVFNESRLPSCTPQILWLLVYDVGGFPGGRIHLPVQETPEMWVQSLDWEDPLEKEMATTPVFLPGEFHGHSILVGYSLWGHKELDMT